VSVEGLGWHGLDSHRVFCTLIYLFRTFLYHIVLYWMPRGSLHGLMMGQPIKDGVGSSLTPVLIVRLHPDTGLKKRRYC